MNKRQNHAHIIEQVPPDYYQKGIEKNSLQKMWHTNKLNSILELFDFSPKTILDVGCASGWFLSKLLEKFPDSKCYGIDLYDKAITYGKKQYPAIRFKIADAHDLPFEDKKFDLVVCTEVLEHVDNPKGVLLEIKRVLKNQGLAIVELDSGSFLFSLVWFLWRKLHGRVWNHAHLHSFNSKRLEAMIRLCGFTIITKKKFNFDMAMAFVITK